MGVSLGLSLFSTVFLFSLLIFFHLLSFFLLLLIEVGFNLRKDVPKFLKQDGDLDAIWRLGGVEVDVGFGCHGYGFEM